MENLFRQRMENMSTSSAASSSIISPNVSRHEGAYIATPSATTTQNFQILPTNLTVTSSTIGASMPAVQNNFSSSVSVAAISSRVPVSEYLKTPQSVFDVIKNNTIGSTSTDLYLKFDKLTESLRAAGLHSMIVGTRCEPVITMENPSGYQSETARRETCPLTGRISTVIVEKDDIFKWTYDSERCYHMVIQMFEKSMNYLFTEERLNYNGKAIFEKAKAFLIGHRDKDIEKSRINLENWRINSNTVIQICLTRFLELVSQLEFALQAPVSESQQLSILRKNVYKDPRPTFHTIMLQQELQGWTILKTIQVLSDHGNNLPVGHATVRLSSFDAHPTIKENHCINYQLGKCTYGDKCKYIHSIDPDFKPREPGDKKSPRDKSKYHGKGKKTDPKFPSRATGSESKIPIAITAAHRDIIGRPKGTVTLTNPDGYSIRQRYLMKSLLRSQDITSDDDDLESREHDTAAKTRMNSVRTVRMGTFRHRSTPTAIDCLLQLTSPATNCLQPTTPSHLSSPSEVQRLCPLRTSNIQQYVPETVHQSVMHTVENTTRQTEHMRAVSSDRPTMYFDSGCTQSGGNIRHLLHNVRPCPKDLHLIGAFGSTTSPTIMGDLPLVGLTLLHVPAMHDVLLSVSEIAEGGTTLVPKVLVFTGDSCYVFTAESVSHLLQSMCKDGHECMRGVHNNGAYIFDYTFQPELRTSRILSLSTATPSFPTAVLPVQNTLVPQIFTPSSRSVSLYDSVHHRAGHPSAFNMDWLKQTSPNAHFTRVDAAAARPPCRGCALGSSRQASTNHHHVHRDRPTTPGQQLHIDGYQNSVRSVRHYKHCDVVRDAYTRMIYCCFTKNRSAEEFTISFTKLLTLHPTWRIIEPGTTRYIRLDPESNYSSDQVVTAFASYGYQVERTPVRDKHAGGTAERTIGILTAKCNVAMQTPDPPPPKSFWCYAMQYAADSLNLNYSSVIKTSPLYQTTGNYVDINILHAFWSECYVHIPIDQRTGGKLSPRALRCRFIGYDYTTIMRACYVVVPVLSSGTYGKVRVSKDVIFDDSINFSDNDPATFPSDLAFANIPYNGPIVQAFSHASHVTFSIPGDTHPNTSQQFCPLGPVATIPSVPPLLPTVPLSIPLVSSHPRFSDKQGTIPVYSRPHKDQRTQSADLPTSSKPTFRPPRVQYTSPSAVDLLTDTDPETSINTITAHADADGIAQYWYQMTVRNFEYPLTMVETTHNSVRNKMFAITSQNPNVPRTYEAAILLPPWAAVIHDELTKFEDYNCLQLVPYTGQHLVPMKWVFTIKNDLSLKARLVGRGDLMKPYVDFDPDAVYCGNVSACSIKIVLTIAAAYGLIMRGGDLVGAYLVTRANEDYPVFIRSPKGYDVPPGYCIQAVGNLYGFPPAGQNFSKKFDECVMKCGYKNTPWDLKLFFKWIRGSPIVVIAHSDDFRWFGPQSMLHEWDLIVKAFTTEGYKVKDCSDAEFVGINITRDEEGNYFMDQTRMIKEIIKESHATGAKQEHLPYPLEGPSLSKADNATEMQKQACSKYEYRKKVGQLMYGMVHTMVDIMYALNVLSRYSNNPGPRHIEHMKHLIRYCHYSHKDRLKFQSHHGEKNLTAMTALLQLRFQCDADLGGNKDNGHSQTAFLGYLGPSLICWCSTDQGSVSTSTAESEIKAVNHTLRSQLISCRGILEYIGWKQDPTVIEEDNQACVYAAAAQHMTKNLRHLDLAQLWFKEKVADGTCIVVKVDSKDNNSDIGTKRVTKAIFVKLTEQLKDRTL